MRYNKNNIKLTTNEYGEIDSITYKDKRILHDAKEHWLKTFPIIFPTIGFSSGYSHEGKEYEMTKHGFARKLKWEAFYEEDKLKIAATVIKNDDYPFSLDVVHEIEILEETDFESVLITTKISNVGQEQAYFHFGYHPAFKIDPESKLDTQSKTIPLMIDGNAFLTDKPVDLGVKIMDTKIDIDYDTAVYKDMDYKSISLIRDELVVNVTFDAKNLQIWKPAAADFICIEPWCGWGDKEYDAPNEVKDKKEIQSVESGKTWSTFMKITFIDNIH